MQAAPILFKNPATRQKELKSMSRHQLEQVMASYNEPVNPHLTDPQLIQKIMDKESTPPATQAPSMPPKEDSQLTAFCLAVFYFSISVVAMLAIYLAFRQRPRQYCEDGAKNTNCIKCPSHAICINGIANCIDNRTLVEGLCLIPDPHIEIIAENVIRAKSLLKRQAGSYRCQYENRDWLSESDLLGWLTSDKADSEKVLEELSKDASIFVRGEPRVFVSINYERPLLCLIKTEIVQNSKAILLSILIIVLSFMIYRLISIKRKREREADTALHFILVEVAHSKQVEMSEEELSKKYRSICGADERLWRATLKQLSYLPNVLAFQQNGAKYYRFL